jgi:hypothetical protein
MTDEVECAAWRDAISRLHQNSAFRRCWKRQSGAGFLRLALGKSSSLSKLYLPKQKSENTIIHMQRTIFKMGKRPVGEVEDGNQAYLKRQKISTSGKFTASTEEIRSARQLRQMLAFDQDAGRSKHGTCTRSMLNKILLTIA